MIGQTLAHYRIDAKLGAGGMGAVYRATDIKLGRQVAIKVLPEQLANDPERLERLEREARVLAGLDHPNIVTLFSVEEAAGLHFLVMALVEGELLAKLIPSRGLKVGKLLDLAVPLVDAVRAAHDHGVVHRDLKPSNVIVDGDGRLRVLDFGLAKLSRRAEGYEASQQPTELMTQEGTLLGTYPYMSPEQAEGKTVDVRSDIFSLGVILYEMATGERPFRGETPASIMAAILTEAPRPIDEIRADLPHHLARIVRRCLEKDPERRYQRAADLLRDLEDLRVEVTSDTASGGARGPIPVEPHKGRSPSVVPFAVALAAIVAAVVAYLTLLRPRPPAEYDPGEIRSLAVLPLDNLMNDPNQEYFVDGMTEALIAELAQISALRVISRTSIMQFKETTRSLPEIAQELDVDALVEGSVTRSEGRVRITAQLLHGPSDRHLWARSYDRDLSDVLALQSEIARQIAREIRVRLTEEEESRLEASATIDPAAYEAFLQGRFHWNRGNADLALEYFERAVTLDPSYATAWAGVADCWRARYRFGDTDPETQRRAREAAQRAIELAPDSAEALTALGPVLGYLDWDVRGALRQFQRAVELAPGYVLARARLSMTLGMLGDYEAALTEARAAVRLDPLDVLARTNVVLHLYMLGRFDEARTEIEPLLQLHRDRGRRWEIELALVEGDAETALGLARQLEDDTLVARSLALGGREAEALELLPRVEAAVADGRARAEEPALVWAALGRREEAFAELEAAFDRREGFLANLRVIPGWQPLHDDPRFEELLERVGIAGGPASM